MVAQSKPRSSLEVLIETFTDWLKYRREMREVRQFDPTEFDRIANDLRVSPHDLEELVRKGPHSAEELPKMLKALGIEEAALANSQPLMLRDMERVCAVCGQKRQCDRDFVAGTAAEHYLDYCPNALTIAQLRKEMPT